jgi:hypothetical protein
MISVALRETGRWSLVKDHHAKAPRTTGNRHGAQGKRNQAGGRRQRKSREEIFTTKARRNKNIFLDAMNTIYRIGRNIKDHPSRPSIFDRPPQGPGKHQNAK